MYRVALINMPFAGIHLPSIALTQLRSVLRSRMADRVEAKIHYINHDFAEYIGHDLYLRIGSTVEATVSGVGDWFFRDVAFPDMEGNKNDYHRRYLRRFGLNDETTQDLHQKRQSLDAFLDELIDKYELHRCDVAGLTSMFMQNMACFALARKLKQRSPSIVTAMGGANCESPMGQVIAKNVEAIDFVFSGPGLLTFPQMLEHLMEGKQENCHQIQGVYSKQKLLLQIDNQSDEIGAELDINVEVPLDYDGYLASIERFPPGSCQPTILFETSRGCWWGQRAHCTFCGLNGTTMQYRAMEPQLALQQFEQVFNYAPRALRFESVDNILPKQYIKDVFPYLKRPKNTQLFYEVKADLNDHDMAVLAKAGVTEIQPGIEALATSTLKLMKKGTTAFHNLQFLKSCLTHGISPGWNLLVGFPGEEQEVYRKYTKDIPQLTHLPPPNGAYAVRFDRFSPYYTLAKEYGLKLRAYDFYAMVYPFPERDLEDLAYFFEDQNYENAYIAHTAKWIKKLEVLVDQWNLRWYQRDGKLKPSLVFEWSGDAKIVRDTRTGTCVNHNLEPLGLQLLECLSQPAGRSRMKERLGDVRESDIETQLSVLRARSLVFEERDRFISLVVDTGRDQGSL